jgi:hypothetical protein
MAKSQEEKDKSILGWFGGSNPNRKKVKKIVNARKKKKKKKQRVSKKLGY